MNFEGFKKKYQKVPVEHYANEVSEKPLVSVCVQTYNHVSYIAECLDSILMQETNFAFEILLGEDASKDGTREICIEYAQKYPDKIRLLLHHRDNNIKIGGQPTGRFNFLYNLYSARGKYIALCEGDDYWTDPLKLQKQVEFMEENSDCSMCVHASKKVTVNNKEAGEIRPYNSSIHATAEDIILTSGNFFGTNAYLLRKEMFSDKIPEFVHLSPVGDYALNLLSVTKGKVYFIDEFMSNYRVGVPGSALYRAKRLNINIKAARVDRRIKMLHSFNKYSNYQFDVLVKQKISKLEFQKLVIKREVKEIRNHESYNSLALKDKLKLYIKCYLPENISAFK